MAMVTLLAPHDGKQKERSEQIHAIATPMMHGSTIEGKAQMSYVWFPKSMQEAEELKTRLSAIPDVTIEVKG
jgi:hypothetical protein